MNIKINKVIALLIFFSLTLRRHAPTFPPKADQPLAEELGKDIRFSEAELGPV